MQEVYICDALRTPIGRYAGTLSTIRPDDLAALVLKSILERNPGIIASEVNDVMIGCANQSGEDNRNVARMALLLAGFPETVPGMTLNRLCGSGLDAVGTAARAIKSNEAEIIIAGGVESMSRAPFVLDKSSEAFSRNVKMYDTTLGWRFINPIMERKYGVDSMMETAENIASDYKISREDQDLFAFNSQYKTQKAQQEGLFFSEIIPVSVQKSKSETIIFDKDEHPRLTTIEKLAALKPLTNGNGTITAGNSSGINDGAAALIIASDTAVKKFNLTPKARILGMEVAGVSPRVMGLGPVPATQKLLKRLKLNLDYFDIIELNEAFAAQSLGCIRELGISDDDIRVNRLGGAIALGHPLGMSGARLVTTAFHQLNNNPNFSKAVCTMCIGVGQGIALVLEKV